MRVIDDCWNFLRRESGQGRPNLVGFVRFGEWVFRGECLGWSLKEVNVGE